MSVKAKFNCNSLEQFANTYAKKVRLSAVTAYNGPSCDATDEDKAFWEATPQGTIEIYINNPSAIQFFTPGKTYYVTFEEEI